MADEHRPDEHLPDESVDPCEDQGERHITTLRWIGIASLIGLVVSDYGFDAWKKEVPHWVYWTMGAVSLGIEVPVLREIMVAALRKMAGTSDKRN